MAFSSQKNYISRGKATYKGNRLQLGESRPSSGGDAAEQEQPKGAGQTDQQTSDPNGGRVFFHPSELLPFLLVMLY